MTPLQVAHLRALSGGVAIGILVALTAPLPVVAGVAVLSVVGGLVGRRAAPSVTAGEGSA